MASKRNRSPGKPHGCGFRDSFLFGADGSPQYLPGCQRGNEHAAAHRTSPIFWMRQIYSSGSLLSLQALFSIAVSAVSLTSLPFRAVWGQIATQRIQEIHASRSIFPGVLGVDRLHRTPLRAQSALHTGLRRLRHNPGHMAFPVRATAGNSWFRLVASGQFFPNLLGKLRQPGLVLAVRPASPQIDGQWSVLRQRQPRRSHETQPTAQYPAIPPMYPHRPDCHRRRPKLRLLHSLL